MKKIMLGTIAALGALLCFSSTPVEAGYHHRCCGPRVQVSLNNSFGVARDTYVVRRYARPIAAPVVYVQEAQAPVVYVQEAQAPVYVYQAPVYVEDVYVARRPASFGLSFSWLFR